MMLRIGMRSFWLEWFLHGRPPLLPPFRGERLLAKMSEVDLTLSSLRPLLFYLALFFALFL